MLTYNLTLSIVMLSAGLTHTWLFGSLSRGRAFTWLTISLIAGVGIAAASIVATCAIYLGLFLVGVGAGKLGTYHEHRLAKRCYQETVYHQRKTGG